MAQLKKLIKTKTKKESKVKDREDVCVSLLFCFGVPASLVFDDSSSLMKGTRHETLMRRPSFGRSERFKKV